MAIDMSQFYQVFFEEAGEHLATMESLLLALDLADPDLEQVNAIFRAAHSIKGSAGTFGFQDMAEVTHEAETLLDRVRKEETRLDEDMLDALLDAGDVLKTLLAAHVGQGEADREGMARVCARLKQLVAQAGAQPRQETASAPAPAAAAGERVCALRCELAGNDVDAVFANLLDELRALGQAEVLARPDAANPSCHLLLTSSAPREAIADIVDFAAKSGTLVIDMPGEAPGRNDAEDGSYGFFGAEPAPAPDEAFGFFEPLAEAPAAKADEEQGYGFFTDVPSPPAPAAAAAAPAAPEPAEAARSDRRQTDRRQVERRAAGGDTSIRVGIERVDQLVNLVGELVITQAMLTQTASKVDPVTHERLLAGLAQLERNTRDLQESVMAIRMVPISVVFGRFPRVVRDISQKLGKQVELKLNGEGTELDKGLIEKLADPLTHLVRNSLDHGIETPEARAAAGKPAQGTITLSASHRSGSIVIEVGDDGAGLNRGRILAKARERGLAVSDAMSDQEVWQLIFEAGFSTAEQVTDVSGRGVGMDVVKKNIAALGGRVDIESMTGVGTRMTVRLPLTLAILDGMSVQVGEETFILPLNTVIESVQPERSMLRTLGRTRQLLQVRGEYLPVVGLAEVFGLRGRAAQPEQGIVVVVESEGTQAALLVDALVGQQQVVIKSLEANYRRVPGVSGATILGDGHVAMILDVASLVDMGRKALPEAA
ncbi:two-component system, chemotaxis family, sensor kinase CheA [Gammaproteobacteria bacterium]|nr:chemotaxis protein CheW [Zoogloeaceae bacterium]MCK6385310.1 chemotaxis protein CheW [Rhodocyclaceae bacterium]CAG0945940.1 two-component system, chemotaxis family, sensor kinase CheA [Gammaproteobacteria bacterium]